MSSNCRWLGAWANGTIGPQPQPQAPLSGHTLLLPTTHPYDYTPLAVKLLSCHPQDGMGIVDDFFKSVTQEPSEHPYFFARRGRAWGAFLKLNSKRKQLFMPDTRLPSRHHRAPRILTVAEKTQPVKTIQNRTKIKHSGWRD